MSFLAINIAIVLPKEIQKEVIGLNKKLKGSHEKIFQNLDNCIPHITILKGYASEEKLPEIKRILEYYINKSQVLSIQGCGIEKSTLPNGDSWQYIAIEPIESLQDLYDYVINTIKPLMCYKTREGYISDGDKISNITYDWVLGHEKKKRGEKYIPHISIGLGEIDNSEYKKTINITSIGIYQLDNYCTCGKELFSISNK